MNTKQIEILARLEQELDLVHNEVSKAVTAGNEARGVGDFRDYKYLYEVLALVRKIGDGARSYHR